MAGRLSRRSGIERSGSSSSRGSMSSAILHAAAFQGLYPERLQPPLGRLDRLGAQAAALFARRFRGRLPRMDRFVRGIEAHGRTLEDRNDRQLRELTWELRQALIREGLRSEERRVGKEGRARWA